MRPLWQLAKRPRILIDDMCNGFQEDARIIELVEKLGPTRWSIIAAQLPGRIGKQARERSLFHSSAYQSCFRVLSALNIAMHEPP